MDTLRVFALTLLLVSIAWSAPDSGVRIDVDDHGSVGLTIRYNLPDAGDSGTGDDLFPVSLTTTPDGRELPVASRFIQVPAGCRAEVVVKSRKSYRHIEGAVQFSGEVSGRELMGMDLQPSEPVVIGRSGFLRGRQVAPILMYPIQLEANSESLVENRTLEVEISFVADASVSSDVRVINDRPGSVIATMVDKMLVNPPHRDQETYQQPHHDRLLILHQAGAAFDTMGIQHIEALAEWKRRMGYRVDIEAVDFEDGIGFREIRNDYIFPRYDDPDDPLGFVILVGADSTEQQLYFPSYNFMGLIGDHFYTLMDDDDEFLSDIALGRIHVHSYGELAGVIRRTILYEREPMIADGTDWFTHAMYTAEDIPVGEAQFVPSMIHLGRWIALKLHNYGYDWVDTLYSSIEGGDIDGQVEQAINEGRSIILSRGWVSGCYDDDAGEAAQTGRKNPFTLAVTCLALPKQSGFYRSANRNVTNGPIASIAITGISHSAPNNSLLGGVVRALTYYGINHVGLLQNFGKYQLRTDLEYNLTPETLVNVAIFRLLGDPTTMIFTDRPVEIEAEHPESIESGSTGLSIRVFSGEEILPHAWVSIQQDAGLNLVCQPDDAGWVRFTFVEGDLEEGDIEVTITDKNAIPYLSTIDVVESEMRIELEEVAFENEDGLFGFGETVPAIMTFANTGNAGIENAVLTLSTNDPYVRVVPEVIQLGNIGAGEGAEAEFEIVVSFAVGFGRPIRIQAMLSAGETSFEHAFDITCSAPSLAVTAAGIINNEFHPGRIAQFSPRIANSGDMLVPGTNARLISLSDYIEIVDSQSTYPELEPDEDAVSAGNFRVSADELAIAGNIAHFALILTDPDIEDGFVDTLEFQAMIGEPDISDPFGPDKYGYMIFDSFDEGWEKKPEYEWKELNYFKEDRDYIGTRLHLGDNDVNQDSTLNVPLPFSFRFYGQTWDTVAINSNGWFAFGADKSLFPDFRNQHIPGIQGPDAQVAVFWQDLINPLDAERGVFYHHDSELDIFIIEWSEYKVYQDMIIDPNACLVEFEAILYDPMVYPTSSGDGEIKLQYKNVRIVPGDLTDNLYCTVGIKNNDGSDGLEYTYWNRYPFVNRHIQNGLALFITTDRASAFGRLEGRITYFEDRERGIEGVTLRSERTGAGSVTDSSGNFIVDPIPVGRDNIILSKRGFNTIAVDATVEEGETTRLDAFMTHPAIELAINPIVRELELGENGTTFYINLENTGSGPLEFNISPKYYDGSETQYQQTMQVNVSELVDNDNFLYGAEFIGDKIYITGGVDPVSGEDNMIYVLNRDGELVRSFRQPSTSGKGFWDLAWNGELLWGGERIANEDTGLVVCGFDLQGNLTTTIHLPFDRNAFSEISALAWNPVNGTLVTSNRNGRIVEFTLDGEIVHQFTVVIPGIYHLVRGLAWNDQDKDGMPLYMVEQSGDYGGIRLIRIDLDDEYSEVIGQIEHIPTDRSFGLTIGYGWEHSVLSLATIVNGSTTHDNDTLRVFEIGPDTHFLTVNPTAGLVAAEEILPVEIEMRAESFAVADTGLYEFSLFIEHSALRDPFLIPVSLNVKTFSGIDQDDSGQPSRFWLADAYPNPFNGKTLIEFTLKEKGIADLAVFDIAGREVARLVAGEMDQGRHRVLFEPDNLASGIYFYRLKSSGSSAVKRMVFIR